MQGFIENRSQRRIDIALTKQRTLSFEAGVTTEIGADNMEEIAKLRDIVPAVAGFFGKDDRGADQLVDVSAAKNAPTEAEPPETAPPVVVPPVVETKGKTEGKSKA